MKKIVAVVLLTFAFAASAEAHTWGGNAYLGGSNPGTSYVTYSEGFYASQLALQWVEGKNWLRWNALYRVNDQLVWVGIRTTDGSLFHCAAGWQSSYAGPTPHGWAVRCYHQ